MSDTINNTPAPAEGTTSPEGGKTFSQEQVNQIVSERLAKEKAKTDSAFAEKERELALREFKLNAVQQLEGKGLPANLYDALNTSSPEAFNKSLEILTEHMNAKETPRIVAVAPANKSSGSDPIRDAMGLKR